MTEKMTGMDSLKKTVKKSQSPAEAEQSAVRELVKAARARGEDLTGPDGLLKTITATMLQAALEEEMTEHLEPWVLPCLPVAFDGDQLVHAEHLESPDADGADHRAARMVELGGDGIRHGGQHRGEHP